MSSEDGSRALRMCWMKSLAMGLVGADSVLVERAMGA